MDTIFSTLVRFRTLLLIGVLLSTLLVGIAFSRLQSHAALCTSWYTCPVTQSYGHNWEHGVDLYTHGLPITALLPGTVTYANYQCWSGECIQDITWRLDAPWQAGGSPYMYVQIATRSVHAGQHLAYHQFLGYSANFIEVGLTPDWAYGVSNWRWGVNILRVFPRL